MFKIKSTKERSNEFGENIILYGEAGTGKTYSFTTAPRPLVVLVERSAKTLESFDVPSVEAYDLESLKEFTQWFESSSELDQFDTICIDSLSEISTLVFKANSEDPALQGFNKYYGETTRDILNLIRLLKSKPEKNIVMVAKKGMIVDEVTEKTRTLPLMDGGKDLKNLVCHEVDTVLRSDVKKTASGLVYVCHTVNDGTNMAKHRGGKLDAMEPLDLGHVIGKLKGVAQQD